MPETPAFDPELAARVGAECAGLRVQKAARRLARLYDDALRPIGLRIGQFSLLGAIRAGHGSSITALADRLAMDRTTLTRNLRPMVKAGWLALGPEGYRRARTITITPAGTAKFEEALPLWRRVQTDLAAELGPEGWTDAMTVLDRLATGRD